MLNVNEIFTSIDGEINQWHQGILSTFVRFSQCNLACSYCDTDHDAYQEYKPTDLFKKIQQENTKKVTLTGGEPLLQKDLKNLISLLTKDKYSISIETNGTLIIPDSILKKANWIMDIKMPSSGCTKHILDMEYYESLPKNVYFKFCISNMADFDTAVSVASRLKNLIAFSPVIGQNKMWPQIMVRKMIDLRLPYVFNVQLHKFLNVK